MTPTLIVACLLAAVAVAVVAYVLHTPPPPGWGERAPLEHDTIEGIVEAVQSEVLKTLFADADTSLEGGARCEIFGCDSPADAVGPGGVLLCAGCWVRSEGAVSVKPQEDAKR